LIRDPHLIELLSKLPTQTFAGDVFRATRRSLIPTTPSTSGGRWSPRGGSAVLYTSLARDGALAEIAFHWSRLTPLPQKPALIHKLGVQSENALRLVRTDLETLGVKTESYDEPNYGRTQEIGDVVSFIGCDGLIVPSARWKCENLILFTDNLALEVELEVKSVEEVDWQDWAKTAGMLP
jgi:RES domain-containing protein